jgi:hypothetical protein
MDRSGTMTSRDVEYYQRRERQEREHAQRSGDSSARRIHLEMADRYSTKVREIDRPAIRA